MATKETPAKSLLKKLLLAGKDMEIGHSIGGVFEKPDLKWTDITGLVWKDDMPLWYNFIMIVEYILTQLNETIYEYRSLQWTQIVKKTELHFVQLFLQM